MKKETQKKWGAAAGATGGGILGLKIGFGLYLMLVAANPLNAFFAAGLPTIAAGLGATLGGKAGYDSPAVGLLSAITHIFGIPGLSGADLGAEGAVEALAEGATETLSS
jgi:hypothetical protein